MKLRLPHKLQAALAAVLATVGFTLPQAQAANTVISNASQSAAVLVTGDITLDSSITSTMAKSSGADATPTQTNYRDSFRYTPANIGSGGGAIYTLNFTVTGIAAGATAQGMTIDFFTLNGGGKPQNSENGYKATVALRMSGQETPVYSAEHTILTYTGNNNYTGSAYEGNPAITPVSQASVSQLKLQDVEWQTGTYTLTITFAQDSQHTGGCFGGVGNIALLCSTISTWQGTEGQHQWVAANFSPEFVSGGDAIFGEAECKTVTVDEAVSAGQVAVNEDGYIFELNNTLTANSLAIEDGASLSITGSGDMSISGLTGAGGFVKDSSGTLSISGHESFSGTITVNAGTLAIAAMGAGTYKVDNGAVIEVTNANMASVGTVTVTGDGTVRLVTTSRSESGNALGSVTAPILELADNSNNTGRYYYSGTSNITGVSNLKFAGGQLWLCSDMTYSGGVTFGTTTYTEGNDFTGAAMRVNASGTFTGVVDVQGTAKLVWGDSNKTLAFNNTVTGCGNIDLIGWNGKTGTFTIGGDASGYEGAMTTNDKITLNVTSSGSLRIGSGSNLAGVVTLDGALTVNGSGTISGAITGSGTLTKNGDGTLELTGTNTYTGGTTVNGGTLKAASLGSGNITLSAGTLEFTNTSAITMGDLAVNGGTVKFAGADLLNASTLSATAGVHFDLNALTAKAGEYILATATGTASALDGVLVDWDLPDYLSNEGLSVTDHAWVITIKSNGQDLTWVGAQGANWSYSVEDENWQNSSEERSAFSNADRALFANTATANVVGDISAVGVLVQNGANVSLATADAGSLTTTDLEINGTLNTALDVTVTEVEATGAGATWNITRGTATAQSLAVADSADLTIKLSGGQLTGATQLHGNATLTAAQTTTLDSTFSVNMNGHTLTVGADDEATLTVQGVLSGEGSASALVKTGEGTVVLTGANTYTGTTTVNAGTLAIAAQAPIGTVVINENGTLRMDKGYTFTGTVSGAGKMTYAGETSTELNFGSQNISQWTGSFDNESSSAITLKINTTGLNMDITHTGTGLVNLALNVDNIRFAGEQLVNNVAHSTSWSTHITSTGKLTATGKVETGRLVLGETEDDSDAMFILSGAGAHLYNKQDSDTEHKYTAVVQGYGTFAVVDGATQTLTQLSNSGQVFHGTLMADSGGILTVQSTLADDVTLNAINGGQIILKSAAKEATVNNGTFELLADVETLSVSGENNTLNIGTGSVENINLGGNLTANGDLTIFSGNEGTKVTADAGKKLVVDGAAHVDGRVEFHSSDTQNVEIAATRVAEQEQYALESGNFDVTAATVEKIATGDVTVANKVSAATVKNGVAEGTLSLTTGVDMEALKNVIAASGDIEFLNVDSETQATLDTLNIAEGNTVSFSTDGTIGDVVTEASVTVTGTLTAGKDATLNANLAMGGSTESTAELNVSAMKGNGGLNMGSTVTLNPYNLALSQADMDLISDLDFMGKYDLFNGVDGFNIGTADYSQGIALSDTWVKASEVFNNQELGEKDYYLFYSGANIAGGNAGNVGTIYIMQLPEPTTGTLSLLALAALVARRRRK